MQAIYKPVVIPETSAELGTGWLPPLPDLRDYTEEHPNVTMMVKKLGISPEMPPIPPKKASGNGVHQ